jgi:hypothetical protein
VSGAGAERDAAPERRLGTVERAFQLARSGRFSRLDDLRRALRHEGHESIEQHLSGPSIRRDLARLCREAQGVSD